MVQIKQNLVPASKYKIKCPYAMTATRIVVHNTANDASAANEVAYMISNNNEVSYHIAVDDKEAVQGVPFNRNTWNAGDGSGKGNREGIAIEICYSLSGGSRFIKAEQNAAELIANMLKESGWGIDRMTKHKDYNGKYCPHRTLEMGWPRFVAMVQAALDKLNKTEGDDMTEAEVRKIIKTVDAEKAKAKCPGWAKEAVQYCINQGYIKGDSTGKAPTVDSVRPLDTLTRAEMCQIIYNQQAN